MNEGLVIPLCGMLIPLILVPSIVAIKGRQRRRECRHEERIRAMELGLPIPPPEHGLGGAVTAVGAGVPVASVFAALVTTLNLPWSKPDYAAGLAVVWGCAFMISGAALVTSLILGVMAIRSRKPVDESAAFKPVYEPDAYDVVSRRG